MKIAITSSGNRLDALVDRRFGRCSFFVIFDTSTDGYEIVPNINVHSMEGAGPASVRLLSGKHIEKVVSGDFGLKVKSLFDELQIQLISVPDGKKTVQQIIDLLKQMPAS